MFTKKFERRIYLAVVAFLLAGTLGVSFGTYILWPSRREAGYAPEQPIAYSHKLHAGELQIECLYCHGQAAHGAHAGLPSLRTCMNCHQEVQTKDERGELTEGMATLLEHWESKTPIVWNKVNDLADFVYFDHSRHVASGIDCGECHGPVKTMEVMRREYGLKMSWCLDCHNQPVPKDSRGVALGWSTRAPTHCTTCHR